MTCFFEYDIFIVSGGVSSFRWLVVAELSFKDQTYSKIILFNNVSTFVCVHGLGKLSKT